MGSFSKAGTYNGLIEIIDIRLMVLTMVQLHRFGIDVRFQRMVRVRELG